MPTIHDAVTAASSVPPWPSVDLAGDIHPDQIIHDALRGIPGALVERALRDKGNWRSAVGPAGVLRVKMLWPMYLLAAHQVRMLLLLYPPQTNHNVWDGSEAVVPLEVDRLTEAEGFYARHWGDPWQEYQRRLVAFLEWSQ